ncbi:MAG: glycosyltransferase [Lachnospiraceae bacterium]|nr:glycosyltransferase [Lachnospiraceae bacterium]
MTTLPISVCIIAKNEEAHIEECLKRIKPYHYEIVLADTGSTDRTLEIAAKYTDKIYHFEWCNDFSAAKNFCIARASHDWILNIDCDEYLESIDEKNLSHLMGQHPQSAGRILIRNRITESGAAGDAIAYENVRVSRFVNRNYFHFVGAVHEQLERLGDARHDALSNRAAGIPSADMACSFPQSATPYPLPKTAYLAPISVLHVGYDGTEEEMRLKALRNITLLEQELSASGPDAYLYYQLGQSCMKIKDYEKAYAWFDAGLSMDIEPALDYVQAMVESYGYCLLNLKRYEEALQLENIYDTFAVRADFVFLMGLIYMNNGLFDEAIRAFQKSTSMEQFSLEGVNSYRANYNIGVIYECTGHLQEARRYYQKCGQYDMAKWRLKEISK